MTRESKISLTAFIILLGFIIALGFCYRASTKRCGYPFDTFLFRPDGRFSDFASVYDPARNFSPYLEHAPSANNVLFPFSYLIMFLFTMLSRRHSLMLFLLLTSLSIFFIVLVNIRSRDRLESCKNALIITFLSYPFLFTFDRANVEIFVFIALYLFFYYYEERKLFLHGCIFLSLAMAMKAIPAVFLVLLASERKFKEALITLIVFLLITAATFQAFKGGFMENLHMMILNQKITLGIYAMGDEGIIFGSSIFGLIKVLTAGIYPCHLWMKAYVPFAVIFFCIAVLYVLLVEKTLWKKISVLTFLMILLPHFSADYRLLHLYIPLLFFINSRDSDKYDWLYAVLFGLLFIPKNYHHFNLPGVRPFEVPGIEPYEAGISIILNPLLMLVFCLVILGSGLMEADKNDIRKRFNGYCAYARKYALVLLTVILASSLMLAFGIRALSKIAVSQRASYLLPGVQQDSMAPVFHRVLSDYDFNHVKCPPVALNDGFTIEFLVKPASSSWKGGVILSNEPGTTGKEGITIAKYKDNKYYMIAGGWTNFVLFEMPQDQWNYVAVTIKDRSLTVYVNGEQQRIEETEAAVRNSTTPLELGNCYTGDEPFIGFIREVRISEGIMDRERIHSSWLVVKKALNR
ncbi:MAG: LamG-like jellyroll fold domain-containing protein [Candidatus Eremiobacteraeota bacterium]|nr:LamG-like jellyroll fold domain-containing protein [Candidatus Eremiobacteraeota bacterium]